MKNHLKFFCMACMLLLLTSCEKDQQIEEPTKLHYDDETELFEMALQELNNTDLKTLEREFQELVKSDFKSYKYGRHKRPRTSLVKALDFFDDHVTGHSLLLRARGGIYFKLYSRELPVDHALTLWVGIFNNPKKCATSPCTFDDAFNPEVGFELLLGAGLVTQGEKGCLLGSLEVGRDKVYSAIPYFQSFFGLPLPDGPGLVNPTRAEIHLFVRSHGPTDDVEAQLSSYEGGCINYVDLNDPPEYADDLGDCSDFQYAIHVAH